MLSKYKEESSKKIKNRVEKARSIQNDRYKKIDISTNSEIGVKQLDVFCIMNKDAKKFLEMIFNKYELSTRGYTKILKVARTIADLKQKEIIEEEEIFEAFSFRETYYNFFKNDKKIKKEY